MLFGLVTSFLNKASTTSEVCPIVSSILLKRFSIDRMTANRAVLTRKPEIKLTRIAIVTMNCKIVVMINQRLSFITLAI